MDSHTLEGLTLRLEAAERGLRAARRAMWWGSILVVLAIGGGAWWVSDKLQAGGVPEAVEAQRFIVRDAQGSAQAVFEALPSGGIQLVFFRDPLPGDAWRQHTGTGPFSFGVRSVRELSQLMLTNRSGEALQFTPGNLSMGKGDSSAIVLTAGSSPVIWLADSTGRMQQLNADMIASVLAKPGAKPSAPSRHRRKR